MLLRTDAERQARIEREAYEWRTTVNLIAAIALILLFGMSYYLVERVAAANKAQLCVESGSRKCQKFESR